MWIQFRLHSQVFITFLCGFVFSLLHFGLLSRSWVTGLFFQSVNHVLVGCQTSGTDLQHVSSWGGWHHPPRGLQLGNSGMTGSFLLVSIPPFALFYWNMSLTEAAGVCVLAANRGKSWHWKDLLPERRSCFHHYHFPRTYSAPRLQEDLWAA